jgi:hypothetical protein
LAARKGYTCELKTLEGPRGFFELYGHSDGSGVTDGLPDGKSADWDIVTDLALKLVPGGHSLHAMAVATPTLFSCRAAPDASASTGWT